VHEIEESSPALQNAMNGNTAGYSAQRR